MMVKKFAIIFGVFLVSFFLCINSYSQCDSSYFRFFASSIRGIHLFDSSHMIAAGDNGDIIQTNDGGQNWVRNTSFSGSYNFSDLVFPTSLVGYASSFYGGIICKTEDGGNTWFPLQVPYGGGLYKMFFFNADKGFVVGGDGHLFSTTNGGRTWSDQQSISNIYHAITFTPGKIGFIVGNNRLMLRSTDEGVTWNPVDLSFLSFGTNLTCVKFYNDQLGFATTSFGGVIKTTNGGLNWFQLSSLSNANFSDIYMYDSNNILFVGDYAGGYIQKTTDGGQTWVFPYFGYPGRHAVFLAIKSDPLKSKIVVVGSGGGTSSGYEGRKIISTTDLGLNWTVQSANAKIDYICMQFLNDSTGFITGEEGLLFKSNDYGQSWKQLNNGFANTNLAMFFIDNLNGFLLNDSLYRSTNGGVTWVNLHSNIQLGSGNYFLHFFNSLAGIYSNGSGIYKTLDGGVNWLQVLFLPSSFMLKYGTCFIGNRGFAVGYAGFAKQSTDGGNTWSPMNLTTNRFLTSVYFYNNNSGVIGTSDSVIYRTINGGATWDSINTGIRNLYFRSFRFVNDSTGYMVGNNLGGLSNIYKTKDRGLSWQFERQISEDIIAIDGFNMVYMTGKRGILLKTEKLKPPGIPGYISGKDSSCTNMIEPYSTAAVLGETYNWNLSGGGTHTFSASKDTVSWNSAGTHTLSVTATNICGTSPVRTLPVTIILFQPTITQINDSVLMSSPGVAYQWYRDNITISPSQGGTVQSLVVRITGIYKVRVTNSLGCIVFSAPYSYIVTNTNDPLLRSVIHVYPTLASNEIYAVLSSNVSGMFTFKVMNSVGQMVKQFQKRKAGVEQIMKISLADLSSGYYFLYISNSGRESVWKFYKQ